MTAFFNPGYIPPFIGAARRIRRTPEFEAQFGADRFHRGGLRPTNPMNRQRTGGTAAPVAPGYTPPASAAPMMPPAAPVAPAMPAAPATQPAGLTPGQAAAIQQGIRAGVFQPNALNEKAKAAQTEAQVKAYNDQQAAARANPGGLTPAPWEPPASGPVGATTMRDRLGVPANYTPPAYLGTGGASPLTAEQIAKPAGDLARSMNDAQDEVYGRHDTLGNAVDATNRVMSPDIAGPMQDIKDIEQRMGTQRYLNRNPNMRLNALPGGTYTITDNSRRPGEGMVESAADAAHAQSALGRAEAALPAMRNHGEVAPVARAYTPAQVAASDQERARDVAPGFEQANNLEVRRRALAVQARQAGADGAVGHLLTGRGTTAAGLDQAQKEIERIRQQRVADAIALGQAGMSALDRQRIANANAIPVRLDQGQQKINQGAQKIEFDRQKFDADQGYRKQTLENAATRLGIDLERMRNDQSYHDAQVQHMADALGMDRDKLSETIRHNKATEANAANKPKPPSLSEKMDAASAKRMRDRLNDYTPATNEQGQKVWRGKSYMDRELTEPEYQDLKARTEAAQQPAPAATQQAGPKQISSDAEYAALASGETFIGPDGKTRRKP